VAVRRGEQMEQSWIIEVPRSPSGSALFFFDRRGLDQQILWINESLVPHDFLAVFLSSWCL
jgi:hypothetical protein